VTEDEPVLTNTCVCVCFPMFILMLSFPLQTMLTAISMSAIATNGVVPGDSLEPFESVCRPSGRSFCHLLTDFAKLFIFYFIYIYLTRKNFFEIKMFFTTESWRRPEVMDQVSGSQVMDQVIVPGDPGDGPR